MERVALRLEQSLPQLELLARHHVFTRDELRALTTQRQAHEAHLARREVAWPDYESYAQFEDRAEQLRKLRCRQPEVSESVSVQEERRLKSSYIARVITIFERALRRLKADLRVWLAYADWARRNRLNVVLGRVLGRAIVLHPKQPSLWILAARQELILDPWAQSARTLFLRALRVNKPAPEFDLVQSAATPPPRKRSKQPNGTSLTRDHSHSSQHTPGMLYVSHAHVRDYIHLALEYIRMEMTVIERTRRRFTKLGIDLSQPNKDRAILTAPAPGTENQPDQLGSIENDQGAEHDAVEVTHMPGADHAATEDDRQLGSTDQPDDIDRPSDQRLSAVLHHAVRSIVLPLLPSPAAKFTFLMGVYQMLLVFPFVDAANAKGSGAAFRNAHLSFLASQMETLTATVHPEVILVAHCATVPIVHPTPLWAPDARVSQHQVAEEMETFARLKAAGNLRLLLTDSEVEGLLAPDASAPATLSRLSAVLATSVRLRRAHDDTTLPPSLVAYSKSVSECLNSLASERRGDEAACLVQGHVAFLQAIRQAGEPSELGRLLNALLTQAYQGAKKGKFLSPSLVLSYFDSLTSPNSQSEWATRAEALRKSLRGSSPPLSLMDQEAWEPVWEMFLDAVWGERGGEEVLRLRNAQEAVTLLGALLTEHLTAIQACPVRVGLWMRAMNLVRLAFGVRDKKLDRWALGALEQLVQVSRKAVTQNQDSSLTPHLQLAHDRFLAAVAATPAQLTKSRSAKSTSKARKAVRALIRSDPIASPAFWLAHARTEANLMRTLSSASDQAETKEELQAVRAYLSTLWSRLRQSTASDPALLVTARLLWLRHLLRDLHDGSAALAALDVSRRDAATLDSRLVGLLESGWQRLSDGRPEDDDDEEEEDAEDDEDEEGVDEDEEESDEE